MQFDCLFDKGFSLFSCFANRDASRKIRHIGAERCRAFFDDCNVVHFFKPACFKILLSVPGGTSTLSFPAIVTVPGLVAW